MGEEYQCCEAADFIKAGFKFNSLAQCDQIYLSGQKLYKTYFAKQFWFVKLNYISL